jgi:hypothetical protein
MDVPSCWLVNCHWHLNRLVCLYLRGQVLFLHYLTLKMKALQSYETSVMLQQSIWHNTGEDITLQYEILLVSGKISK